MKFEFKPSFDRLLKSLASEKKEEIKKVAIQTIDILSRDRIIYKGIGLKRLRNRYRVHPGGVQSIFVLSTA